MKLPLTHTGNSQSVRWVGSCLYWIVVSEVVFGPSGYHNHNRYLLLLKKPNPSRGHSLVFNALFLHTTTARRDNYGGI